MDVSELVATLKKHRRLKHVDIETLERAVRLLPVVPDNEVDIEAFVRVVASICVIEGSKR